MAADSNVVEILVKSRDEAAPDMDDLKARLEELGHEVAEARVDVEDADAAAKLDAMRARLDDLNHKTANPKITMSGALRAEAQIHAIEASLDNLKRKEDETLAEAGGEGLLSRILMGSGGEGDAGAGGGMLSTLLGPGGLVIVPAIEAALSEVTALMSGFAAAGAGAGAFALLAVPAFEKVKGAIGDSKAQLAKLSPDERGAVEGIRGLESEFGKLSTAFQPQAFKVFNGLLQVANNLLPVITPFANQFANAIDGLLKKAGSFTESKGFKDWLKQFQTLVGPSTTAIGNGIGQLVTSFGKLMTIFSKKDVVNAINIAFSILNGILTTMIYVVERLKSNWDGITHTFDTVRHAAAELASDFSQKFDQIRHDIAQWADDVARDAGQVVTWFKGLPHRIVTALGDLKTLLVQAGKDVVTGFINGIESMFGGIASAGIHMAEHLGSNVLHFLGIGSPSKVAHWWGQMVAQGMAEGITAGAGNAAAAAARMAAGVNAGLAAGARGAGGYGYAGTAAAAGGGGGNISFQLNGGSGLEQQFWTWFKNGLRAQGGDPAIITKKVQFK